MSKSTKPTEVVTKPVLEIAQVEETTPVVDQVPETVEEHTPEVIEPEPTPEPEVVLLQEEAPIYIPEIPAQVEESAPVVETETSFLTRLMDFQNNGGWGRHLNPMIKERLKLLNGK